MDFRFILCGIAGVKIDKIRERAIKKTLISIKETRFYIRLNQLLLKKENYFFPLSFWPAWPRKIRVGANSPNLCPTIFSVT